jgi:hypothetical protein
MIDSPRKGDSSAKLLKELTAQPFLTVLQALAACSGDPDRAYILLQTWKADGNRDLSNAGVSSEEVPD